VRNLRIREDTAKVFNVWFLKISIAPPQRVTGNSEEEGVLKAKIFKGKYEPKLEFPEGWGFKPKNPPWGGIWTFLEQHSLWIRVLQKD